MLETTRTLPPRAYGDLQQIHVVTHCIVHHSWHIGACDKASVTFGICLAAEASHDGESASYHEESNASI